MNYIVTALKPEAQAFVEKFHLKKSMLKGFVLYQNDTLTLIQSGVGIRNALHATQTLFNHFDMLGDEEFFNIGVCGASKNYSIGELVSCGGVEYEGIKHIFKPDLTLITCKESAQTKEGPQLVDMESFGFYEAVTHNPAIADFHILKVVSDHFAPHTLTKDMVKSLILKNIDAMEIL